MNIHVLKSLSLIFIFVSNAAIAQSEYKTENEKNREMKTKIYVVNSKEKSTETKDYFNSFNARFKYLSQIELVFQPENEYKKFQDDLNTIKRGWSQTAEIVDTRELAGYDQDPVRLLLTDNFFELSVSKKDEAILHELGHFFTNPDLLEIRKYIAKKNPPLLNINNPNLQNLTNAHNTALNFLFQIPKLVQEISAELWVYEHERDYSESRIKDYCVAVEQSLKEFKNAKVNESWFYNIPNLNFLILWRLSIFKSMDFDYINNCIEKTNEANVLFKGLAKTVNFENLKIFTLQTDIINSLDYSNENIIELIKTFEIIYNNYIVNSARFFPLEIQTQIVEFYKSNE